jgi:hypothetical protein
MTQRTNHFQCPNPPPLQDSRPIVVIAYSCLPDAVAIARLRLNDSRKRVPLGQYLWSNDILGTGPHQNRVDSKYSTSSSSPGYCLRVGYWAYLYRQRNRPETTHTHDRMENAKINGDSGPPPAKRVRSDGNRPAAEPKAKESDSRSLPKGVAPVKAE